MMPFNFEFDPILRLDAILTLPDATRDESVARAIRLEPARRRCGRDVRLISHWVTSGLCAIHPGSRWRLPLPCDLAHAISIEFEGIAGRIPRRPSRRQRAGAGAPAARPPSRTVIRRFELGPSRAAAAGFDRTARPAPNADLARSDPDRGWADPDIRSIWPGRTQTDWVEVEIVRR